MFDNIAKLRFGQGPSQEPIADAMMSSEGEMMEYRKGVAAEGKVEDWMTAVLNEMRRTNRLITKESVFNYCEGKTRLGGGLLVSTISITMHIHAYDYSKASKTSVHMNSTTTH